MDETDDTIDDDEGETESWYVDVILADSRLSIAGLDGMSLECYGNSATLSMDGEKVRFYFEEEQFADEFALLSQLHRIFGKLPKRRK